MVKYQIAQQVFKRNFDRFSIACDHSSIIIIIIIIIYNYYNNNNNDNNNNESLFLTKMELQ